MERDYIPLSKNIVADPKVQALQVRYGNAEGLGHWCLLMLQLYNTNALGLDMSVDYLRAAIAGAHGMSEDELTELLDLCAQLTLIDPLLWRECKQVANTHINEHKQELQEQYERRANAGRQGGRGNKKQS